MRLFFLFFLLIAAFNSYSDTMENYMNLANDIPKMEMKADSQSQAWARSARSVLLINDDSIAESLLQANEIAKSQGKPLFCLPTGVNLNATTLHDLILQTYQEISSQQSDKNKMPISQVAWLGVVKKYPCPIANQMNASQQLGGLFKH